MSLLLDLAAIGLAVVGLALHWVFEQIVCPHTRPTPSRETPR